MNDLNDLFLFYLNDLNDLFLFYLNDLNDLFLFCQMMSIVGTDPEQINVVRRRKAIDDKLAQWGLAPDQLWRDVAHKRLSAIHARRTYLRKELERFEHMSLPELHEFAHSNHVNLHGETRKAFVVEHVMAHEAPKILQTVDFEAFGNKLVEEFVADHRLRDKVDLFNLVMVVFIIFLF